MTALPSPDPSSYESLAQIAAELARSVGEVIRELRNAGVDVAATKSSVNDVVTAADREAERLLSEGLRIARPDDGVLGEEGASRDGSTGVTWVIDPIDGTVNYLYGLPSYAVSVAATVTDESVASRRTGGTHDGRRAVAGAVYLPVTDELFTAFEGGGASLNGAPLTPVSSAPLENALIGTGFGYTVERRTEQAEIVRHLIPRVRDIRRLGSAAADLCLVAAGRLDGYYERGLQPWDYAAGALIAREAGALLLGRDTDTRPGEPMFIAAAPELALALSAEISDAYSRL